MPLVGDFHYHGHLFLTRYPDCAKALAKLRINPGNVGFGKKRDQQFEMMIEVGAASTTSRCGSASTGAASMPTCRPG